MQRVPVGGFGEWGAENELGEGGAEGARRPATQCLVPLPE